MKQYSKTRQQQKPSFTTAKFLPTMQINETDHCKSSQTTMTTGILDGTGDYLMVVQLPAI